MGCRCSKSQVARRPASGISEETQHSQRERAGCNDNENDAQPVDSRTCFPLSEQDVVVIPSSIQPSPTCHASSPNRREVVQHQQQPMTVPSRRKRTAGSVQRVEASAQSIPDRNSDVSIFDSQTFRRSNAGRRVPVCPPPRRIGSATAATTQNIESNSAHPSSVILNADRPNLCKGSWERTRRQDENPLRGSSRDAHRDEHARSDMSDDSAGDSLVSASRVSSRTSCAGKSAISKASKSPIERDCKVHRRQTDTEQPADTQGTGSAEFLCLPGGLPADFAEVDDGLPNSTQFDVVARWLAEATATPLHDVHAALNSSNLHIDDTLTYLLEAKAKKGRPLISCSDREKFSEIYDGLQETDASLLSLYRRKMGMSKELSQSSYSKDYEDVLARQFASYNAMVELQQSIVPLHLRHHFSFSEIILESSIVVGGVGQILMLPWNESDPDIRHNFWVDELPPVVRAALRERGRVRSPPLPPPASVCQGVHLESPKHFSTSSPKNATRRSLPLLSFRRKRRSSPLKQPRMSEDRPSDSIGLMLFRISQDPATPHLSAEECYAGVFDNFCPVTDGHQQRAHEREADDTNTCNPFTNVSVAPIGSSCNQHPSLTCRAKSINISSTALLNEMALHPDLLGTDQVFLEGWSLDDGRWTDPDGYISLSQKQRQKFHAWKRITELQAGLSATPCVMKETPRSSFIRQGFVGDCSFLSSLAVLAEFEASHQIPVLSSIIYPQKKHAHDPSRNIPVVNERGLYACRLHFNGVPRKVVIDDYVPVRKDAHSANKNEFWVTLLEKSFVKLMGGSYFMQGSNPGADLYHLTGWIPETVPFRMDIHTGSPDTHQPIVTGGMDNSDIALDPKWDAVWRQLYDGLTHGRCVACLGTSEVADAAPSGLDYPEGVSQSSGIVARHAYSVIDFKEIQGHRLLSVKNPWCCIRWRGTFSPYDEVSWTESLQKALHYNRVKKAATDDGCFWIDWVDVIKWFSHLYICWNSNCFPYETEVHSKWDRTPQVERSILPDDSHLVAFNPQFLLSVDPVEGDEDTLTEVWVLLSRHVRERTRDLSQKYLAVHVHAGCERVACPPPPVRQGIYSNGECTLVKLFIGRSDESGVLENGRSSSLASSVTSNLSEGVNHASILPNRQHVLVVSQYSRKDEFNFTIKVFSRARATLTQLPPLLNPAGEWVSRYLKGSWIRSTAGGCSNDLWSYFRNPHVRLFLPRTADINLFLECPQEHSVNIRLFRGPFANARTLRSGRALTSGPYRSGCCVIRCRLEAGCHTIIVSTFRPGELGDYQLGLHLGNFGPEEKPLTFDEGRCPFWSDDIVLAHLPYAHLRPPITNFFHKALRLSSHDHRLGGFGGIIRIKRPSTTLGFINTAIRLEVHHIYPEDALPSMTIYRRANGPLRENDASAGDSRHQLIFVMKSDLEGGQNPQGRSLSSAAQDLYRKQRVLTISHLCLDSSLFPYYIAIAPIRIVHSGTEEGGTVAMTVGIGSPRAPRPLPYSATDGDFTLHLISDQPTDISL